MIPTRLFWIMLGIGFPVSVMAAWLDMLYVMWIYNGFFILFSLLSLKLAPDTSQLLVRRKFDPVLSVRVANRVVLEVENLGAERVVGRLRDEPPPSFFTDQKEFDLTLDSGRATEYAYHTTPPARGADYFRNTSLRIKCPLGLMDKIVPVRNSQPVRVYPNVLALREFDLLRQRGKLNQIGIRHTRIKGLGTDFESMRDYGPGDDFRKIDWKATARRGKITVREYEQERNQTVLLCIDIGRGMLSEVNGVTKLDHVLDALLMLAHAANSAGDQIGLLVYSNTVKRYIPPKKGFRQVGIIIDAIHDLVAEPIESDPAQAFSYLATRWKRRSLLIHFCDVEDADQARILMTAMGRVPRQHIALQVRVSDPKLKSLTSADIEEQLDMYNMAASLFFLEERDDARARLDGHGMHTLDSEPQELASSLVSYYFYVKERSLL